MTQMQPQQRWNRTRVTLNNATIKSTTEKAIWSEMITSTQHIRCKTVPDTNQGSTGLQPVEILVVLFANGLNRELGIDPWSPGLQRGYHASLTHWKHTPMLTLPPSP
jgi:hypothetical protein